MLELVAPFLIAAAGGLVRGRLSSRHRTQAADPRLPNHPHDARFESVDRGSPRMAPPFYIAGGGAVLAGLASGALVLARHHCSCALRPRASDRLAAPVDDSLRPPQGGGRARLQGAGCPDDGGAQPSV